MIRILNESSRILHCNRMIVPDCIGSEALKVTTIYIVVFEEMTSCKLANT